MRNTFAVGLATIALALGAGNAFAVDADTFNPSGSLFDGQGTVSVVHPSIWFSNAMYGGTAMYWASQPVVLLKGDGSEEPVVGSMIGTYLGGGYNILGKARVDLGIPLYPFVGMGETSLSSGGIGDIRLTGVIPILDMEEDPIGFAFVPAFQLPTGSETLYVGAPSLGLDLGTAFGGFINTVGWAANANLYLSGKEEVEDLAFGTNLNVKGAVFMPIGTDFKAGAELSSMLTFAGGSPSYNRNPMEASIYGQFAKEDGLVVTTGLGTGVVAGVGAPAVRLFLAASYHTLGVPPVYDIDADGIPDASDRCPNDPEDRDAFSDVDGCPDLDNDSDNIADVKDQCPLQPEDMDNFHDEDGCPDPDNDGDKILDAEDLCPVEAGTPKAMGCPDRDGDLVKDKEDKCIDIPGPAETAGCPDRDKDKVPDMRDKCPDVPADPRADPARSDGCPSKVIVTKEKIEIMDKIFFETNKAKIMPKSFPLLTEIAKVLNDNPDIMLVEVAGHTDNKGDDAANQKLSDDRAASVLKWLVNEGKVDASRLVSKGYGETRPIDTNDTDAGRANNRRVEFVILKQ